MRATTGLFYAVLAALGLAACSEASRTTLFESLDSPAGDASLQAFVIEPWFPQGPHHVLLLLQDSKRDRTHQLARAELAYDGVPFTKLNINLRWTSERSALACLRATDRPDQGFQISLDDARNAKVTLRKGC